MATTNVSSGQTSSGLSATSGNEVVVLSGGTAVATAVDFGGAQVVSSGGLALKAVMSGGTETVSSAGTSVSASVVGTSTTLGLEVVSVGGTALDTVLSAFGWEQIASGGTSVSATLSGAAEQFVLAGGLASNTVLSGGATIDNGTTFATVVKSGQELVESGGIASGTVISSGGSQSVYTSGMASATVISNGGAENVFGGAVTGVVVLSGGWEYVYANAADSATVLSNGGGEVVSSGGTLVGASIQAGGSVFASSGNLLGTVNDAGLLSGGTIGNSGAVVVSNGGKTSGLIVASGGTEVLSTGGTAVSTTVLAGGTLILAGGTATGLVLNAGAVETTTHALNSAIVSSGTVLLVSGTNTHTAVLSGGTEIVLAGGSGVAAVISSGGTEIVSSGGFASGTVVSGGGVEVLASGGTLAYNGGSTTFSGTLQGGGTLDLTSDTFTYAGPAGSSNVGVVEQGGTLALKASETFGGGFTFSGGAGSAVISSGATLTIGGSAGLTGGYIDGPGTLVTTGVTSFYNLFLDRNLTWINGGTVTDTGYLLGAYPSGSGSIIISNTATGTFDLVSNGNIEFEGNGTQTFINAGTLAEIGSGNSYVSAVVSNTGTIAVASGGSLAFYDGGTFKGTLGGAGTIVFQGGTASLATGHTDTFGNLSVGAGAVSSTDAISVTGTFVEQGGSVVLAKGESFAAKSFDQTGGTISLATNTTLASATVDGTIDLDGTTLTLTGSTNLSNAEIVGPGVLDTTGATTFGALLLDGGLTWINGGTVTDSAYAYLSYPSGSGSITISNTSAGVFDLISGGEVVLNGSATQTFINAGTLAEIGSGTGYVGAFVSNTGTISAASGGSLLFEGGGSFKGSIGGAGTMVFQGGSAILAAGHADTFANLLIDGGIVSSTDAVSVTGTFTEQAGSLTLGSGANFAAASFDQTGGTISLATNTTLAYAGISGTIDLDKTTLTLTGSASLKGEIIGPGTLVTTGATSSESPFLDGSLTWINSGAVTQSGIAYLDYPSGSGFITIINTSGGLIDLTSGGRLDAQGSGSGTLINAGTLAEIGSGYSYVSAVVSNTGTVTVASGGSLTFFDGGSFKGNIGGAGTIVFGGGTATLATGHTDTFGNLSVQGGVVSSTDSINVTGTFSEDGGSLALGSGDSFSAATFDQTYGTLALATNTTLAYAAVSGTIDLDGATLTLTGATAMQGAEIVGSGTLDTTGNTTLTETYGNLYLDGGLTWINGGTVTEPGAIYLDYPSGSGTIIISNTTSGVFDLTSNAEINLEGNGTGTFINGGTLANLGNNFSTVSATVINTSTGTLTATGGTLELLGGGTLAGTLGATNTKGSVLLDQGAFTTAAGTSATIADDGTATGLTLAYGETWTDSGAILDAGHLHIGNLSGQSGATLAITSGSSFTLTGADAGIAAVGTATITNAGTISQTGPTGLDTISVGIANTGLIDAGTGTLALTGAVTGNGALRIESTGTLELGQSLSTTQSVTFNGAGGALILEKPATIKLLTNFGAADRIDLAGVTATAAGTSGDVLTVSAGTTTYTFTSNESLAADHAKYQSDGNGGTLVTLYAEAVAAPHAPEPVAFGNVHVGAVATQALTVANGAPAGPYSEALDASLGSATTGFTTSGTITGIAGGTANSTALTVTENTANAGTLSGTATLTLLSDGTGIDGFGTTALPSQTVTMNGAVYAYAAPSLSATTVNLGAARLGGVLATGSVSIANGTTASAYQESLLYAATGPTALTLTNASGTVTAGSTATLGVSLGTTTAGNFTGSTATVALTSTGAGTSGLANTTLAPDSVTVNAEVFAPAVAGLLTTIVNVGIVHVGDTVNGVIGVTNAGSGALVDLLTAGTATVAGEVSGVSYGGLGSGVTSGADGTVSLSLNTVAAGTISGSAVIGFDSHDSALADIAVAGGTVSVTGTIDNYAVAAVEDTGGAGTLTGSGTAYVLNLGTVAQGATALSGDLGVINAAVGQSDLLGGTFAASGSSAFTNTGTAAFASLAAGQADTSPVVTLNTATAGVFTETLVVDATGSNASGYSGSLANETITVTGTVVSNGTTYTLTGAPTTIPGTTGNDTIDATSNTLNSHDTISGAGGVNTLNLLGSGFFDLGAPASLTDIQIVTAQESAAGTTIYMRNALAVTLDVAPTGSGSLLIYGGSDSDIYNLGAGSDTIVVGAATETVNAGGGTALVQATNTLAGALVNGGTVGSAGTTTLEITTGGTATLNGADTNLIVKLDAATNLGLGKASFITAEGAVAGHDTITAGGATQTLESLGGNDTLVGAASFGDTFLGASTGLAGDTIKAFGGSDTIDITDMLYTSLKTLTYTGTTTSGKLGITDGTHNLSLTMTGSYTLASFAPTADGHGGTLITFV